MFVRAIAGAHPELVQLSIVIAPETLENPYRQPPVLGSAIGELVPGPVVNTDWNVDVLVDIKEVGLPPGVDVDRESLERALKGNYAVYQYDVLPDRVILYMWPSAGGSDFAFRFRPPFAMQAETAPSLLYDYYNPEASVTVKPSRFDVTQGKESMAPAH